MERDAMVGEAIEYEVENKSWPGGAIECRQTITEHESGVTSLAYHEGTLYSGAYDGSIQVHDMDTGNLIKSVQGHKKTVWTLALHPETQRFFSAGSDGFIKAWSTEENDFRGLAAVWEDQKKIYSLAVHGDRLYSSLNDGKIKVWNLDDLTCIATLEGHTESVNALSFLNSTTMISASSDKTIKIWDLPTSTMTHSIEGESSQVLDVTVSSGMNHMLFSSSYEGPISAYDLNSYSRIRTLTGHGWGVWDVEFIDGYLFSGSHDQSIKRWDPRMFAESCSLTGHKGYVHALVAGDSCLYSGSADASIKKWR
ncbi:hypothetical protein HDU76_005615 [Blyttiomyces sp. JEL0837]|nr:hypothetical protein HDU76_005615 [Blyttiomyces sp. JEL0837]